MKRIIAAAFVAVLASAAFAQQAAADALGRYITLEDGDNPPAGYVPHVPSYEWKDGRFVRNGQVYKSLHGGN
jgi:hypothetical protein